MYKNILVPVSLDQKRDIGKALSVANLLCDPNGTITVVHVIEDIPQYALSYVPEDFQRQAHQEVVDAVVKLTSEVKRNAKSKVLHGHAGRRILDFADEDKSDCIVIASHRPEFEDYFIGSTAARVVRHAGCAVHVIR